jgi:hypothetical protein
VGLLTSGAKLFSTFNDNHAVAVHVTDHFSGRAPVLFALMLDSKRRLQPQMVAEDCVSRTGLRPIDHEAKLVDCIRVLVLEVDSPKQRDVGGGLRILNVHRRIGSRRNAGVSRY